MKFEDVENARQEYINKLKSIRKKSLIVVSIFALIFIVLAVVPSVQNIVKNFSYGFEFSPFLLVPILVFVLMLIFFPIVIVNIVALIMTRQELKAYKRMYKAYFVSKQLAKYFTKLEYNRDEGLNEFILSSTGIIDVGDRYSSNDLVKGKYKNVDFTQADVKIERKHKDNDGDETYSTLFKGRFMIFEFPKRFNFKMMVIPSSNYYISWLNGNRKLRKVEVESTEFNKNFHIYAEDGFEAFYILDPVFMAGVEDLGREYNDQLALYFIENKLLLGINNGNDSFEPPNPKNPVDEQIELDKVTKDIKVITDFVDSLKLDRNF